MKDLYKNIFVKLTERLGRIPTLDEMEASLMTLVQEEMNDHIEPAVIE